MWKIFENILPLYEVCEAQKHKKELQKDRIFNTYILIPNMHIWWPSRLIALNAVKFLFLEVVFQTDENFGTTQVPMA